ncbi:MAG: hypothetical protein HQ509_09400 [Candidatus Marinimicrobia bacterium]|nr:hypothetical protein [Candidatus Neomarinimicrobiota bacterium]
MITGMWDDINCPYCGAGQEINHDDGYGYEEGELYEQECPSCNKIFVFDTLITFSYTGYKADCSNGSEHIYEGTHTYPVEYSRMRCTMCACERKPTKEEMAKIITERQ